MTLDAADIIFNLSEVYASCTTYEDRGLVRHFEDEQLESYRHRIAFKTRFERLDKYYFEFVAPPVGDPKTAKYRVSALWSGENGVYRVFHPHIEAQLCPSLDAAIASSTGISRGSSLTVASYILPSLKQRMRTMFRLKELNRIDNDDCLLDGVPCYLLKGKDWKDSEEEMWIEKDTYLFRRVRVCIIIKPGVDEAQYEAIKAADPAQAEEYRKFRLAQTEEKRFWSQIDYHEAAVNQPLSDRTFAYDPESISDLIPSFNVL